MDIKTLWGKVFVGNPFEDFEGVGIPLFNLNITGPTLSLEGDFKDLRGPHTVCSDGLLMKGQHPLLKIFEADYGGGHLHMEMPEQRASLPYSIIHSEKEYHLSTGKYPREPCTFQENPFFLEE